jgi:aspartyl-tRNA(Asn)/glutamyl-tRNA(Gln) amidotransferase subunit B
MKYESVIGLEVHVQLNTKTKTFCSCPTDFGAEPNTQTCAGCQGQPGVLPVFNKEVLKKAVQAGLSIKGTINKYSVFDRKNYFYPDLPNGFQITQFFYPICQNGSINISLQNNDKKTIRINRIHIEENAGKLVHSDIKGVNESYIDLNRAGNPLLEIVTEPDLRSSDEAYQYLSVLKQILEYINVSDCDMEKGSLRCDANVSIRPFGQEKLGTRVEIKNMNSLTNVRKAIDHEIKRQIKAREKGETLIQETRLYDADKDATFSMRTKEMAEDYRYYPDPDLYPIEITDEYINDIRLQLPELPDSKKERYINEYNLPAYDAEVLTSNLPLALYYEEAVNAFAKEPKKISNWIMSEMMKFLNEQNITANDFIVKPQNLGNLIELIDNDTISGKIAKDVFDKMVQTGKDALTIIDEQGLKQVSDTGELEKIITDLINANPKNVEQYKSGKTNILGFFVGQVMKETKGQANPKIVNELLKKFLD